jgi:hypothetical protein
MKSILMVKVIEDGKVKFRTYKADLAGRAIAAADARDYGSEVEEYRDLPDGTFERVRRDK